mmetsp:Transcript_9311/g.27347  ORF Transcript_9311/g.27347 Transcript_9311/m.27347 type:complete len:446 (-) Transcript_9311:1422-2759(-)
MTTLTATDALLWAGAQILFLVVLELFQRGATGAGDKAALFGEDLKFAVRGPHGYNVIVVDLEEPLDAAQRALITERINGALETNFRTSIRIHQGGFYERKDPKEGAVFDTSCPSAREYAIKYMEPPAYDSCRLVISSAKRGKELWLFGHHSVLSGPDIRWLLRIIFGAQGRFDDAGKGDEASHSLCLPRASLLTVLMATPVAVYQSLKFRPYPPTSVNVPSCNFENPGPEWFFRLEMAAVKKLRSLAKHPRTGKCLPFAVVLSAIMQLIVYAASDLEFINSIVLVSFKADGNFFNSFGFVPLRTRRPAKKFRGAAGVVDALTELCADIHADFDLNKGFALVSAAMLHVPRLAVFDSFVKNNFFLSTVALPIFDAGGASGARAGVRQVRLERMDQGVPSYAFCVTNGTSIDVSLMTKHHAVDTERLGEVLPALRSGLKTLCIDHGP